MFSFPQVGNRLNQIRHRAIFISIALSFAILMQTEFASHAQGADASPPEFTVEFYSIEADCITSYMLIKWQNEAESNVTGFKIHAIATEISSGTIENRWVNLIPIAAKGAGKEYTIINSAIKPNTIHLFRLYGFEKNNLLSKAKHVPLGREFVIYCIRLPLTAL